MSYYYFRYLYYVFENQNGESQSSSKINILLLKHKTFYYPTNGYKFIQSNINKNEVYGEFLHCLTDTIFFAHTI